jgi:hypothetical protein
MNNFAPVKKHVKNAREIIKKGARDEVIVNRVSLTGKFTFAILYLHKPKIRHFADGVADPFA